MNEVGTILLSVASFEARFQGIVSAELLCGRKNSDEGPVGDLIRAMETPESRVAIVAAIRPNKRKPEPDSLDETFPFGSSHRSALADRALADFLGENEQHKNRPSFVSV
jgi:hypothetical protein